MKRLLLATVIAVSLGAFSGSPAKAGDETLFGTGLGAALGGLLGSQFGHGDGRLAYTGLGVFTGGLVGNSLGRAVERTNAPYRGYGYAPPPTTYYSQSYYYEPTYVAPPTFPRRRVVYVQPDVVEYRITPPAPVYVNEGYAGSGSSKYCREYTQQIRVGNSVQESYGTACLQPDGTWQIE